MFLIRAFFYSSKFSHPHQSWKKMSYSQNMAWGHLSIQDGIQEWFDEYKVKWHNLLSPYLSGRNLCSNNYMSNLNQLKSFLIPLDFQS